MRGHEASPLERALALTAGLAMLSSCDSGSPTAPAPAPSALTLVVRDAADLGAQLPAIEALLRQTFLEVDGALDVGPLTSVVTVDPARTIPGWGLGGYTLGPREIELVFDPQFPRLDELLTERLPHIVAHELHHAVRWRDPGPYRTLLEAMVSEGLADDFALELLGGPLPPWSNAFPRREGSRYLDRARPEFDSTRFDFGAWFFGLGTDLPPWTGYTLGYRLVRDYRADHPATPAAQLVSAPADAFRPD